MARKTDPSPRKKSRSSGRPRRASRAPKPSPRSRNAPANSTETYWQAVRKPVYALVFLLPMMALYELGVVLWGHQAARLALAGAKVPYHGQVLRNGADALIRCVLQGISDYFGWSGLFLSGAVIVLTLIAWQIFSRQSWSVNFDHVVGMTGESVLYASLLPLLYVFLSLRPTAGSWFPSTRTWMDISFDLGAGVYEEFIFRLVIMGLLIFLLVRFAELDFAPAGIVAACFSAVVFATAHHVGCLGEPFSWMSFAVRAVLGLFFGAIFIARGFAVAAGTHVFYNILVRMVLLSGPA